MKLLLKGVRQVLEDFKRDLERELGLPVRLFLFGSYAKGLFDACSDLDLVVLLPFKHPEIEDRVLELAFSYAGEYGVPFSVLLFSEEELMQEERRLTFKRLTAEAVEIE